MKEDCSIKGRQPMKTTLSYLRYAAVAGLAGAMVPSEAGAAENILFNCFFPPQHYVCRQMVPELGKRITKATNGRVTVTIPPKSVAPPPDLYDAVVNGVADGTLQFNQFLSNKVAGVQVAQLPFVGVESSEQASVALWRTYQKFFADKHEYKDVVLLSVWASNGAEFYSTTDAPIRTIDDIKDRKMWALPGTVANIIKATGSPVVAGPAVQMLEIISKGVVDGYTGISIGSAQQFKLRTYTKSVTIFKNKIFQPSFSFFVSEKKWAKLSPADQKAVRDALGEDFARWAGKLQDTNQESDKAKFLAGDIKRLAGTDETLAALKALGKPVTEAWVKRVGAMGVDGNAAIAYYEQALHQAQASAR
jgi:TRAP-type C4-dicarboxylate transport system substrate-binding protein